MFAKFSNAAIVFVGAVVPGFVSKNRFPHELLSPLAPPVEFTQLAKISASVLISLLGAAIPAGTSGPGVTPSDGSAYAAAVANAAVRAATSLVPEPTAVAEVIYGLSAATAATVVTSLIEINVPEVSPVQAPSAVIIARFGFVVVGVGSPPVAVIYTSVALVQLYNPVRLKFPFPSVVTVCVSNAVDELPSPVVPTV